MCYEVTIPHQLESINANDIDATVLSDYHPEQMGEAVVIVTNQNLLAHFAEARYAQMVRREAREERLAEQRRQREEAAAQLAHLQQQRGIFLAGLLQRAESLNPPITCFFWLYDQTPYSGLEFYGNGAMSWEDGMGIHNHTTMAQFFDFTRRAYYLGLPEDDPPNIMTQVYYPDAY